MVVLREGAHLSRHGVGVEAQDLLHHQRVGDAVRDVVEGAELVGHRVHDAEEGVREGHAGHRRGVRHLLAGLRVRRLRDRRVVALRQVLEDVLQGLDGEAVGVARRHHRGVGLEGVGDGVDARRARQAGRRHHLDVGVDDRHLRHQLVVGERILHARLLVGDDGERRHLRARAGRGRDRDEVGLLAHLRERVDALADVHEAHRHVLEVALRVLVEDPHDLRGVHRRAAADRDDHVRLERGHELGALLRAGEGRVRRDVGERREHDALLLERGLDRLGVAVRVEEAVGDDEGLLLAHHLAELAERHREAPLLLVHLLGRAEPQHVLPANGHSLDVDEVLDADVLRDGVPAPAAAAERERRREREVVDVADAAEGRRRVDDQAARLHAVGERRELLLLVQVVDPEDGRVAEAAVVDEQRLRDVQRVREVLRLVHAENRRELLVAERLARVRRGRLADEDLRVLRDLEAGHLGDRDGALADDLRVQRAVDEHRLADEVLLLLVEEVAAALLELVLDRVVDLLVGDDRLLGRADHAVVEGLGVDDGVDGVDQVGRRVDDRRGVAGADADGRGAGRVGRLDHAGAARREDDVRLLHEEVGLRQARLLDPADDLGRGAGLDGRVEDDLRRRDRAALGARVRADDDAVAGLQREERLEDRRGGRVGGRDDRADDADRLRPLLDAHGLVALDDAAGLRVLVGVVDVFRRVVVLDHLVLDDAHAGLLDRHLGERDARAVRREGGRLEDRVDLPLGVGGELPLRLADPGEHRLELRHAVVRRRGRIHCLFVCHSLASFRCCVRAAGSLSGGTGA